MFAGEFSRSRLHQCVWFVQLGVSVVSGAAIRVKALRRPSTVGLHSVQRSVSNGLAQGAESTVHTSGRSISCQWLVPQPCATNINKEVIFHKMVFESLNLGPSASNSACGSTKNMPHRAGCDLRLRSRVASTTPKTCFCVQYRHCELRNFKNHDPRNRNREMIVSRGANKAAAG